MLYRTSDDCNGRISREFDPKENVHLEEFLISEDPDPEERCIKKDLRMKMLAEMSDGAFDTAYTLLENQFLIRQFFRSRKGTKIQGVKYSGQIPIEKKNISRRMLFCYLRDKGFKTREANYIIAEIMCYAVACKNI